MELIDLQKLLEQSVKKINSFNLAYKLAITEVKIEDGSGKIGNNFGCTQFKLDNKKIYYTIFINLSLLAKHQEYDLMGVLYHELAHCLQVKELLKQHYLEIRGSHLYTMKPYSMHDEIWQQFVKELTDKLNIEIYK